MGVYQSFEKNETATMFFLRNLLWLRTGGGGQMSKSTFCDQQFARYHDLHLHCDFDIEGQSNMFPTSLILWVHISKPRLKCS